MNDEQLLDFVEQKLMLKMFDGCVIDDHLGRKKHDVNSWAVSLRADQLNRLLDMARVGVTT
jgi:hypothetical protein